MWRRVHSLKLCGLVRGRNLGEREEQGRGEGVRLGERRDFFVKERKGSCVMEP